MEMYYFLGCAHTNRRKKLERIVDRLPRPSIYYYQRCNVVVCPTDTHDERCTHQLRLANWWPKMPSERRNEREATNGRRMLSWWWCYCFDCFVRETKTKLTGKNNEKREIIYGIWSGMCTAVAAAVAIAITHVMHRIIHQISDTSAPGVLFCTRKMPMPFQRNYRIICGSRIELLFSVRSLVHIRKRKTAQNRVIRLVRGATASNWEIRKFHHRSTAQQTA